MPWLRQQKQSTLSMNPTGHFKICLPFANMASHFGLNEHVFMIHCNLFTCSEMFQTRITYTFVSIICRDINPSYPISARAQSCPATKQQKTVQICQSQVATSSSINTKNPSNPGTLILEQVGLFWCHSDILNAMAWPKSHAKTFLLRSILVPSLTDGEGSSLRIGRRELCCSELRVTS